MNRTDLAETLQHSSSAYQDGYDAYEEGDLRTENPYDDVLSAEYRLWDDGWLAARQIDEDAEDNGY